MRLADKFTTVRIVFAPVFLISYLAAFSLVSYTAYILAVLTGLLVFAEITDYLDGKTARKRGQVSDTGKMLDPFADALLHITIFFCFTWAQIMPAVAFMLIFYREFSMLFLRLYAVKKGMDIAARMGGKLKTVLYVTTCFWTLLVTIYYELGLAYSFDGGLPVISLVLFIVCVLASYLSFFEYIYRWVALSRRK